MRRQDDIYKYIIEFITENGYPPTVREIRKEIGANSTSTVHVHLKELQERGLIKIKEAGPRAIKVNGYEFVKKQ